MSSHAVCDAKAFDRAGIAKQGKLIEKHEDEPFGPAGVTFKFDCLNNRVGHLRAFSLPGPPKHEI